MIDFFRAVFELLGAFAVVILVLFIAIPVFFIVSGKVFSSLFPEKVLNIAGQAFIFGMFAIIAFGMIQRCDFSPSTDTCYDTHGPYKC